MGNRAHLVFGIFQSPIPPDLPRMSSRSSSPGPSHRRLREPAALMAHRGAKAERKQQPKVQRWQRRHPKKDARKCAFPGSWMIFMHIYTT